MFGSPVELDSWEEIVWPGGDLREFLGCEWVVWLTFWGLWTCPNWLIWRYTAESFPERQPCFVLR